MIELREQWIWRDGQMIVEGSARQIDEMLLAKLSEVAADSSGWRKLYRHNDTGKLWELDYPLSESHGGGPRRLRELNLAEPDRW